MASALASLTANYTDSEGEEDQERQDSDLENGADHSGLHPSLAERLGRIGKESSPGGSSNNSSVGVSRASNSAAGDHSDHLSCDDNTVTLFQELQLRKLNLCPT